MKTPVYLIADAERDLMGIYRYVAAHDSVGKADMLLDHIEAAISRLGSMPRRGHAPHELERIDVFEYREIVCKSYRIIYQILDRGVFIHCVLDGRRNLQDILFDRLVR